MTRRVVYGIQAVRALARRNWPPVASICVEAGLGAERRQRLAEVLEAGHPVREVPREELTALTGTPKHQGVAAIVEDSGPLGEAEARLHLETVECPLVLVLDSVRDPRNLGACLRTADAAGVDLVVAGRSRTVGVTPVVSKVAAGAAETQPLAWVSNLSRFLRFLADRGVWLVGTDAAAPRGLYELDLSGPLAIVLGGEGEGLRRLTRERCDALAALPMLGGVESLNVSVAAGVCLYEALRQRQARLAHQARLR